MAVTTWSFGSGYEGWSFTETLVDGVGSATRSHVSGATRITLVIPSGGADKTVFGTNQSLDLSGAYPIVVAGDKIEVDFDAPSDAVNYRVFLRAIYTDATEDESTTTGIIPGTLTVNMTAGKTLRYIEFEGWNKSSAGINHYRDFTEVRLTTANPISGTGQRPLGLDVDLENGGMVYVTAWDGDLGGDLLLKVYDADIALQNTYTIADNTAGVIDIDTRVYFLSPYTPPFFGTASLDDIVYIYGRWNDGAVKHIAKSTDGGASFANIGDSATWGSDWVGGFFADDANTLYAFVNGGSPALYRSLNAGGLWTNLSVLPFDVDPHAVSKHPDGRILIANRINGAQMAAYADSAYAAWTNATGSPSFPTAGGGARGIVWVT